MYGSIHGSNTLKLDAKGVSDVKALFVSSALASIALDTQMPIEGFHSLIYGLGTEEVNMVESELRKIVRIANNTLSTLDELDRELCSIGDINQCIWENCTELCPELLALYVVMNAFTESKDKSFDNRISEITKVKTGVAGSQIVKFLNPPSNMEDLDAKMWNTSKEIINLIKGNKNV